MTSVSVCGAEAVAARLELDAQLPEVVDLAVEGDDDVGRPRWPSAGGRRRQVDDRQAAVAEADRAVGVVALAVGAAVGDARRSCA